MRGSRAAAPKVGLKPERADFRPEMADSRPGRADLRPERADFRPERADFKPERAGGRQTNKQTDKLTKVPLSSTGLCSLCSRCPKTLDSQ